MHLCKHHPSSREWQRPEGHENAPRTTDRRPSKWIPEYKTVAALEREGLDIAGKTLDHASLALEKAPDGDYLRLNLDRIVAELCRRGPQAPALSTATVS